MVQTEFFRYVKNSIATSQTLVSNKKYTLLHTEHKTTGTVE